MMVAVPSRPALADVRAARLFADGVKVERAEGLLQVRVRLAARSADLEPGGLGSEAADGGDGLTVTERT